MLFFYSWIICVLLVYVFVLKCYSFSEMVFAGDVIQLIHNYPLLYDPADVDYKNAAKKEEAWNAIGEKLHHCGKYDSGVAL